MKFHIISPDERSTIDHVLKNQMLDFLPQASEHECDVVGIPISYFPNYVFNKRILSIRKPVVFFDMTEYGWNYNQQDENVLGCGCVRQYSHIATDEWEKLDNFVRDHPPLIQFKRELKATDKSPTLMPVEHLCYLDPLPIQSEAEYEARPIEVSHVWGYSHPARANLHADIFKAMATHDIGVISELNHLDGYFKNPSSRTWTAIFKPWYGRSPMPEIMSVNVKSKISVSLPGAGVKCFRSAAESPVGSLMALHEDAYAWSYPWEHGVNCIRLRPGFEFEDLLAATRRPDLYELYLACQDNVDKYRSRKYVDNYIIPTVEALL